MYRSIGVIAFSLLLAACHPRDQAIYDKSKECLGTFDVALTQIPPNQFRKAGLYHDEVDKTAVGAFEDALKFGANTGLDKKAVLKEVMDAKQRAVKAYEKSRASDPTRSSRDLLNAVKECMPKPAGPNE